MHTTLLSRREYHPQNLMHALILYAILAIFFIVGSEPTLKLYFGLLYIVVFGYCAGNAFFSLVDRTFSWFLGVLILLTYYALAGALVFYSYALTPAVLMTLILLSPLLLCIPLPRKNYAHTHGAVWTQYLKRWDVSSVILASAYGILLLGGFMILFRSSTTGSLVSPWLNIPASIFIFFFILSLTLLILLVRVKYAPWWILVPYVALVLSVSLVVFPLGYGFDPFIHQATERLLITTGTIAPRPFAYVGYYAFIAVLQQLLPLSVSVIDRFLLPVLGAIMLPLSIYTSGRYLLLERRYVLLYAVFFFLLPHPELIQSTPQGLSFLFAFMTIMLSQVYLTTALLPAWSIGLVALATAAVHPLTGIPIVLFAAYCIVQKQLSGATAKKILMFAAILIGFCAIPISLGVSSLVSRDLSITLSYSSRYLATLTQALTTYRYVRLDDLIYSFQHTVPLISIGIAFYGYTRLDAVMRKKYIPYVVAWVMLSVQAFFIQNFFNFNFTTPGEQSIFSARLMTLAFYFLYPLMFVGLYDFIRRVRKKDPLYFVLAAIIAALMLTVSWYLSYPRFDTREQHKGYTASADDYTAVSIVHSDGSGTEYIVFANQTVSAVAVSMFGFERYYQGMLYYPLPTSGPLYQEYLALMIKPENIMPILTQLKNKTDVHNYYVIIDNYWDQAPAIRDSLRTTARKAWSLSSVEVFKFVID